MNLFINSTILKVIILMITTTLCSTVMMTLIKLLSIDLHSFIISFFRCFFGLVIFIPFLLKKNFIILKTNNIKLHLARSLINCISMTTWFFAIGLISLEKISAIGFTSPIFATLLAIIILKEVIKMHHTIAIILGFIGILLIIRPGYIDINLGTYSMLTASISFAIVIITVKELSKSDSSLTIIFYMLLFMTPILFFFALSVWETPSIKNLLLLFMVALFGFASHLCFIESLKITTTTVVMPFTYLQLIWASLTGFIFFQEKPDIWSWAGGTIVFLAVFYISYRESFLIKNYEE